MKDEKNANKRKRQANLQQPRQKKFDLSKNPNMMIFLRVKNSVPKVTRLLKMKDGNDAKRMSLKNHNQN